jgi:hypothetical protein
MILASLTEEREEWEWLLRGPNSNQRDTDDQ